MDGIFHDAQEVYVTGPDGKREWHATFSTKAFADRYVANESAFADIPGTTGYGITFEVTPV